MVEFVVSVFDFLELASFRNVHNIIVVIIFFEIFRQKEFVSFSSLCRVELGPDGHFCPGRLVFFYRRENVVYRTNSKGVLLGHIPQSE